MPANFRILIAILFLFYVPTSQQRVSQIDCQSTITRHDFVGMTQAEESRSGRAMEEKQTTSALSSSPSNSSEDSVREAEGDSPMEGVRSLGKICSRVSRTASKIREPPLSPPPDQSYPNADILTFEEGDPENPYNWPIGKKTYVLSVGIVAVLNSTLGSSLPSNAISFIAEYFHVTDERQLVLPISLYLVGYVLGPMFFGPLSETYGRKLVIQSTFFIFTLFTLACAVAPSWPALLIFRLICGINASSPIAVVGGLFADLFDDPIPRGRAMAIFMAATACGPMLAPTISGFVSVVSWRWTFWVGLIFAGVSLVFLSFLPETFGPILLQRRARQSRKHDPESKVYSSLDLEKKGAKQMITVVLMRPLNMIAFEAIVLFTCLYLSLAYAIFYLFFEAYPIIFQGQYGMSPGISGLAFLPILAGAMIALGLFLYYDSVLQKARQANKAWVTVEEYRRLPLACLGGPLWVIALFWLGWSSRPGVHWIVPMLAGVPFGIGFMLIFMALLNYLTDAYEIYAASAMAATSFCRSIFGALLPLAARSMYQRLGIAWATSSLGFLSLALTVIPFAFIKYGDRIRANSRFCNELKARKEEERMKRGGLPDKSGQDRAADLSAVERQA